MTKIAQKSTPINDTYELGTVVFLQPTRLPHVGPCGTCGTKLLTTRPNTPFRGLGVVWYVVSGVVYGVALRFFENLKKWKVGFRFVRFVDSYVSLLSTYLSKYVSSVHTYRASG